MNDVNSLSHASWNCKYHIVFAPKYQPFAPVRGIFFLPDPSIRTILADQPKTASPVWEQAYNDFTAPTLTFGRLLWYTTVCIPDHHFGLTPLQVTFDDARCEASVLLGTKYYYRRYPDE